MLKKVNCKVISNDKISLSVRIFTLIFVISSFSSCARFDFNDLASSGSFSLATITGITGGTDLISDVYLMDGNIPTVHWLDEATEIGYSVTIYENDGATVKCSVSGLPANTIVHTFTTCPLDEGNAYIAAVEFELPVTSSSVVSKTSSSSFFSKTSNKLNSSFSTYGFLYPSTVSLSANSAFEDDGNGCLTVDLSAPSDWPVQLSWNTFDGSAVNSGIFKDYDAVPLSNITIPVGLLR